MDPFIRHHGITATIATDNIDTDQIIPSREMQRVSKTGLGEGLFAGWRYRYEGRNKIGEDSEFVLNRAPYRRASILLAGRNFGCGSSREHAVWALRDFGFRAIIAASYGRIFKRNCARNNVLAITLSETGVQELGQAIEVDPALTIDLEAQHIETKAGKQFAFETAAFDREMLLKGLNYIDYTLQFAEQIDTFIERDRAEHRWAYQKLI